MLKGLNDKRREVMKHEDGGEFKTKLWEATSVGGKQEELVERKSSLILEALRVTMENFTI